ncbi:MAG TPA: YicC/YloC family endoribonuclease [Terriglobales bacterium]|nr:YicC/YloC family endoribonuclease [Terriglobales bacterium]
MSIRSMTGFAQVKGQVDDQLSFTLSLKSVNHRFLDLHMRMPADTDALEMKLRRTLKEKLARGHVELVLSLERSGAQGLALNKSLVSNYVHIFRAAAKEFSLPAEPDLNAIFKVPGMLEGPVAQMNGDAEAAVLLKLEEAVSKLDHMRADEGKAIERELRERIERLRHATREIDKVRTVVLRAYMEKLQSRLQELMATQANADRILQEAAVLAERSDIQEECVRMQTHIDHFLGLLSTEKEVGKKMDFLLQEMGREANTLLSKTSGVSGEALKITEYGLAMKAEIEKLREQVQNIE